MSGHAVHIACWRYWRRTAFDTHIKAVREKYPKSNIIAFRFTKHCEVLKRLPYFDAVRQLNFWGLCSNPIYLYTFYFNQNFIKYYVMAYHYISLTWAYSKSAKEIIGETFGIELKNPKIELFFTKQEEKKAKKTLAPYKNVVIMHI